MSALQFIPPGEGETLTVAGDRVRILVDSSHSDGRCLQIESTIPPGGGPPLHRHSREDELFFVLEGNVKFHVNGQDSVAGPGASVLAPRGSVHAFRNMSAAPARMLITCLPGGLEQAFRAVDRLASRGPVSPEQFAEAFRAVELEILGPPLEG